MSLSMSLPFPVEAVLSGLALIGTLLFADITLERAKSELKANETNSKNKAQILKIGVALALISIYFFCKLWYGIYQQYGAITLTVSIALTVVPFFGYGVASKKGYIVSLFVLLAIFLLLTVFLFIGYSLGWIK